MYRWVGRMHSAGRMLAAQLWALPPAQHAPRLAINCKVSCACEAAPAPAWPADFSCNDEDSRRITHIMLAAACQLGDSSLARSVVNRIPGTAGLVDRHLLGECISGSWDSAGTAGGRV